MTAIEWAGSGLFLVGLVLGALLFGFWKQVGTSASVWLALEAAVLGVAGAFTGQGQLPLPDTGVPREQVSLVVASVLGALGLWHIGVVMWISGQQVASQQRQGVVPEALASRRRTK